MAVKRGERSGAKAQRPTIGKRVENLLRRFEQKAIESGRKRVRIPFYMARVLVQVVQQWVRDRCPQQAASLAFQTMLSSVPMLAVTTAALRALGYFDAESSLVNFVAEHLLPVSREEISTKLVIYSQNITFESLGLIGLITSVFLAFVMFNNLERIANYIWRAEKRRSITQKFVVFYFSMTVGPLLIGLSLVQAARFGLTSGYPGFAMGIAATLAVCCLANMFLPVPKVRASAAIVGALVTTVLFEAGKFGFSIYVSSFALSKYSGIYGAIAIVPIMLIWVYYSWMTLMLGLEVSHAVQHLDALEGMDRRGRVSLQNEILRRVNGVVAARVMLMVVERFAAGEKVTSRPSIGDRFDLSDHAVDGIIDRLADADLVLEVEGESPGIMPARPPDQIMLGHVLSAFRGEDVEVIKSGKSRSKLDKVLTEIEDSAHERTDKLSMSELVALAQDE